MMATILTSVLNVCFASVPDCEWIDYKRLCLPRDPDASPWFEIEAVCIMIFSAEFVLRVLACPAGPGIVAFCRNFANIIDVVRAAPARWRRARPRARASAVAERAAALGPWSRRLVADGDHPVVHRSGRARGAWLPLAAADHPCLSTSQTRHPPPATRHAPGHARRSAVTPRACAGRLSCPRPAVVASAVRRCPRAESLWRPPRPAPPAPRPPRARPAPASHAPPLAASRDHAHRAHLQDEQKHPGARRCPCRGGRSGGSGAGRVAPRPRRRRATPALSLPLRAAPQGMMVLARTLKKSISALGMLVRGTSPG